MDKMKRQKIILTIVGGLVATIILFPFFIAIIGGYSSAHKKIASPPTQNPLEISSDDNWETFSTESYKISYPPEMYMSDEPLEGYTNTFLISGLRDFDIPLEIQPRIQIYASGLPVDKLLNQTNDGRNKEQFAEFSELSLARYKAYQTKALDPEVIFTHTIIGDDDESYLIELFTIEKENDALKSVYDKMIYSFEILKNE